MAIIYCITILAGLYLIKSIDFTFNINIKHENASQTFSPAPESKIDEDFEKEQAELFETIGNAMDDLSL